MALSLFTSESVSNGHPDKVADRVSDAVLDAMLAGDPDSRVACETMVTTGMAIIAGEVTSAAHVDLAEVVREAICDIGYTDDALGINGRTCAVMLALDKQSPDISQGVSEGAGLHAEQGAGDQGMMFGYACDESEPLMPLPIHLAHRLVERLAAHRASGEIGWLRPDSKSQVTVAYGDDGRPVKVTHVVIATQHDPSVCSDGGAGDMLDAAREEITEKVIRPVLPAAMVAEPPIVHINPTGRFVLGGPHGDCGLTGRKIIVDTYGGMGRHGGGAFSGKDPSKVDRSASYMARYIAKNIVAAGLARRCEVQLAYAIGVAEPVSVRVDSFGTASGLTDEAIAGRVREVFSLTPRGIIEMLDLKRPIYQKTVAFGHFGREDPDFTWERTDKAEALTA